jgi:GWxTD domain-containing protein
MVYRDTLTSQLRNDIERQLREISLADFRPARYELEITLHGRRNKELYKTRQDFSVTWSDEALIKHDFKTALSQLELISESGDLDSLKAAQTDDARRRAFDAFWHKKDPTPGTAENEAKQEFYRRVSYANRRFTIMRREGWRTDRGRIYIRYGHPDQIDDVPMSPSYPPYQVWHYYTEGRYRRFTFVDENFDGEYRLTYPYDGLNQRPDF